MTKQFAIGQTSLEVCQTIVSNMQEIDVVRIVKHAVVRNWRQENDTLSKQIAALMDSLDWNQGDVIEKEYNRSDFLKLRLQDLHEDPKDGNVWTMESRVTCNGKTKHIPMMNFHIEGMKKEESKPIIINSIKHICKGKEGVLLDSGRWYHYYGNFLLEQDEWYKFLGKFTVPCILVSGGYIGHSLNQGFCGLRLTSSEKHKPKVPTVVDLIK